MIVAVAEYVRLDHHALTNDTLDRISTGVDLRLDAFDYDSTLSCRF
jgi:hypothetical protein